MSIEEKELIPSKQFNISPKTPNTWLIEQRHFNLGNARIRIAEDMIENAKEIESGIIWHEVLENLQVTAGNKRHIGKWAIVNGFSATVGSVAAQAGWDMHSPEIVYQSGYLPFWALGKEVARLNERIQETEAGIRTYISEEKREATLALDRKRAPLLGIFRKRLGKSLHQYLTQELSGDPLKGRILQALLFSSHNATSSRTRIKILGFYKQGDIEKAAELVDSSYNEIEPFHDVLRRMGLDI